MMDQAKVALIVGLISAATTSLGWIVLGVVQIRVTPKTRNPFTIKALSISGVTWKWHFLNHAQTKASDRCKLDANP